MARNREFNSVAELREHYRRLKRRMSNLPSPPPKPDPAPEPEPPKRVIPPAPRLVVVQYSPARRTPLERIVFTVSREFAIPVAVIFGPRRLPAVVLARSVAFYLGHELRKLTLTQLGKMIGKRDHTTVLHALRSVSQRMMDDHDFAERIERLRKELEEPA